LDARGPPGLPRRPYRRPGLAISARRCPAARDARGGAVPRAEGGGGPRAERRGAGGRHAQLAALSPSQAVRAQEQPPALHRTEAALVPAALYRLGGPLRPGSERRAGVRELALGGLLDP